MAEYPGGRVGPEDPRYATLVRGFNLRWVGSPRYVELCGEHRAGRAGRAARGRRRPADHRPRRRALLRGLRLGQRRRRDRRPLRDERGLPATRTRAVTCIEGGATLWDVYCDLYRLYGVTLPGGLVLLGRRGRARHRRRLRPALAAARADGRPSVRRRGRLRRLRGRPRADRSRDAATARTTTSDLLWGNLGGGGGNFGVVTQYFFRDLPRAPSEAHLLTLAWDWERRSTTPASPRSSRNYGEFLAAHSDVGSPYSGLFALLHLFQRAGNGADRADRAVRRRRAAPAARLRGGDDRRRACRRRSAPSRAGSASTACRRRRLGRRAGCRGCTRPRRSTAPAPTSAASTSRPT